MLILKGITKDYASGGTSVRALRGIDLAFGESEFAAILGPSGCGKTTLLNIIGGLDRYTSGDLVIHEAVHGAGMGYLPQPFRGLCVPEL